jgi:DNA-binding NtrC family response regulator
LLIEDDPDVSRSARVALSAWAKQIETLETADNLENVLRSFVFDAVLLDMNFVAGERAGKAGLDALACIINFDPTLAVVLMTAYGGVSLAVEALKKGAVDFILKPWHNEKLLAAVTAAGQITRTRRAAELLQLDAVERRTIERALTRAQGNISTAASVLGLSRAALYRRMAKYGL